MGTVLQAAVIGFASGLKAVKSWDDNLRHRAASRRFSQTARHSGAIADDTFRLAFESASLGDLQATDQAGVKALVNRATH